MKSSIPNKCLVQHHEKDVIHFDNSLQVLKELRDLRSQLHHAAEDWESTFLNAKEKKVAVENTKEYVCRAVVALVDHFGNVSDNLNTLISQTNEFSEADLRIHCLNQRIVLCEQYAHKLALNRLRFREIVPRLQPRYLSAPIKEEVKSDQDLRCRDSKNEVSTKIIGKHVFEREDDMPLFVYTYPKKQALSLSRGDTNSSLLLPVRDGFSILSKASNPSFQFQESRKISRSRRARQGNDIFSFIRRAKRTM